MSCHLCAITGCCRVAFKKMLALVLRVSSRVEAWCFVLLTKLRSSIVSECGIIHPSVVGFHLNLIGRLFPLSCVGTQFTIGWISSISSRFLVKVKVISRSLPLILKIPFRASENETLTSWGEMGCFQLPTRINRVTWCRRWEILSCISTWLRCLLDFKPLSLIAPILFYSITKLSCISPFLGLWMENQIYKKKILIWVTLQCLTSLFKPSLFHNHALCCK